MFKVNEEYQRDALLDFVGSKQNQSGIIWGDKEPGCVIITSGGRHGKMVGYGDKPNDDGSWSYIGQGSKGDQDPNTFANSLLTEGSRAVFLFSTREPNAEEVRQRGHHRKLYRFEGIFKVMSWDFYAQESGKRVGDKLIIFSLILADNVYDLNNDTQTESKSNWIAEEGVLSYGLNELRERLPTDTVVAKGKLNAREYKKRSQAIKQYALLRAMGKCENCLKEAPFITASGVPFLEVHHIFSLADDGPDTPENVAAICPNCHKESHFGIDKRNLNDNLYQAILSKENSLHLNN
jgi:5-methylcytosine-specific restriction enzyme A